MQRRAHRIPLLLLTCVAMASCGSDVSTPIDALKQVDDVQAQVGLKQMEMALLACHAQTETFVACPALPPDTGVTITAVTPTTFELTAGELQSRYDAMRDTVPCHTRVGDSPTDPSACIV